MFILCEKYVRAIENEDTIYCCKPAIYLSLITIFLDAIMISIEIELFL